MAVSMLAFSTLPPASASAGASKSTDGGNKSEAKSASVDSALKKVIPMLVNIDRTVSALDDRSDRSCIAIVVKDDDWKVKLNAVRSKWQELEKERRKAGVATKEMEKEKKAAGVAPVAVPASQTLAAAADDPLNMDDDLPAVPGLPPHPMGGPQRAVMLHAMVELAESAIAADNESLAVVKAVRSWSMEFTLQTIFRARPRNYTYAVGKPWIWSFMIAESVKAETWTQLRSLFAAKSPKCFVAQQLSHDGPNTKWLLEWQGGKGKGKGNSDGEDKKRKKGC